MLYCFFFFFFKQKTAYEMRISDWSSDVLLFRSISFLQLRAGGCRRWNSTQEPNRCLRRCIHRLLGGARNHRVCPALRRFCRLPPGTSPTYCNDAKQADRTSFVSGKSVSVRLDIGGRRIITKNKKTNQKQS